MLVASAGPAGAKSAEEVFAEVAPSVVVVLALDDNGETAAQGSGVVVGKNEVATNCHVIENAQSVAVRQAADSGGGETYRMDSRILTRDGERDLCLLFVGELSEPPAAPVAAMRAAKGLAVGEEVYAIGAPKGLELSLSRGVVSQLRGVHGKRAAPLVQTDAAISPGSSGGGLFNADGELVGITTFKWRGESLNFAIPAEWVGELREKGKAALKVAEQRRECMENPNYECVIAIALSVARSIDDADYRAWALHNIALARAESGDINGAFAIARSVDNRAWFLRGMASAQAESGDIDGAFATARSIDDAFFHAVALHEIALAQAELGNIDGALATARSIDYPFYLNAALHGIVSTQAESGDIDGAFATARSVDDAYFHAEALRLIALAQVESGDTDNALATARSIDDDFVDLGENYRVLAFRDIASAQARVGDIGGAFATARSIDDAYYRAWALRNIASAQAESGEAQSAQKTFTNALSTARSIHEASRRADVLSGIASAQARIGDIDGALATAHGMDSRVIVWLNIASAQARVGDIDGAFATAARSIDYPIRHDVVLDNIALAQAEAKDFRGAMKTAMGIEKDEKRARALADIAKHLAAREKE